MSGRPLARQVGHVRRRGAPIRRRSAGLTAARAGGALAMVVAAAGIYGLVSSPIFGLDRLTVEGATITSKDMVRSALDLPAGSNLVTLDTAVLAARVGVLPSVRSAEVAVGLPGTLRIRLVERVPILAWAVGDRRFLVDVDGFVFAELGPEDPLPTAAPGTRAGGSTGAGPGGSSDPSGAPSPSAEVSPPASASAALGPSPIGPAEDAIPVVSDRRASAVAIGVGAVLDPIDLDAARRLGSLRPADAGSVAAALAVSVDDADGFVVAPAGGGWTAVFGFYTPSLRTTDMIPGQVRLLRSLLAGREGSVARVVLASETDGTYLPGPSAAPSTSPKP